VCAQISANSASALRKMNAVRQFAKDEYRLFMYLVKFLLNNMRQAIKVREEVLDI